MLKVGITGGIGSGKTTVCKLFEILGIPVFYADTVAKAIMHTDDELKQGIRKVFGEQAYMTEGLLNRQYLADIVFNNEAELQKLNSLVHPAVFRAFETWLVKQKAPYIIKEAALLFESGSDKMCDYSVLVKATVHQKIRRVMLRDEISAAQVRARMGRQFSDKKKVQLADFILFNNEKQLLIPQVLALHERFIAKSKT